MQEQRFPEFVRNFLRDMFPKGDVPKWVCEAMDCAGISLEGVVAPEGPAPNPVQKPGEGAMAE